jgi:hypothetical protein
LELSLWEPIEPNGNDEFAPSLGIREASTMAARRNRFQFRLMLVLLLTTLTALLLAWRRVDRQANDLETRAWRETITIRIAQLKAANAVDSDVMRRSSRAATIRYYQRAWDKLEAE